MVNYRYYFLKLVTKNSVFYLNIEGDKEKDLSFFTILLERLYVTFKLNI